MGFYRPTRWGASDRDFVKWFLDENANANLIETNYTKHIIKSNPNKDTIPPQINLSVADSGYFNSDVNLEYLVKENQTFLDSAYYILNQNRTDIPCEVYATPIISAPVDSISGTIPISQQGEHNLIFYANDIAMQGRTHNGNKTIKNIKFFIDKISPDINITYPENKDYVESVDSMIFSV